MEWPSIFWIKKYLLGLASENNQEHFLNYFITNKGGNEMRKCTVLLMIVMLLLGTITGCKKKDKESTSGSNSGSSGSQEQGVTNDEKNNEAEDPVVITYWQHSSAARDEMMNSLIAEFEKQHQNIKIKAEFIPEGDYAQKLVPSLATDSAPDVFQVQSGMVSELAKADSIKPLDSSVMSVDSIINDFVPAAVNGLKYNDKYYGMPTDMQTIILFWNKKLVSEAGLDAEKGPQSWDEFFDWARKLTKTDGGILTQSGWGGKGYFPEVLSIISQYGGSFYDSSKNEYVFADDPKSVEAISTYFSAYKDDKVYDTEFVKNWAGFRQGLVGMMLGHPAMLGNLPETAPDLDFEVNLIPAYNNNRSSCVTSWGYVMSKNAPSKEATQFIQFLSSEEVEKKWTEKTGELPARKSLLADPDLKKNPKVEVALNSLNESFVGMLQTSALASIWSDAVDRILHTDEDLQTILKDMQNKLNEEVAK